MASNNFDNSTMSSTSLLYRNGPTSPLEIEKSPTLVYDSDGDDDTLLALSSLAKMETNFRNEIDLLHQNKLLVSSSSIFESSADYIDIVQQAIDAVEDALVRWPKYDRRKALTELIMHAKLEQAKKITAYNSGCLENANVWAEMLMQVQELGRNYPKDPQVHELVYLVQQCLTNNEKHVNEEKETHKYGDREREHCETVEVEKTLEPEIDNNLHVCGRLGEVDVDCYTDTEGSLDYRITEEIVQAMSNQFETNNDEEKHVKHEISINKELNTAPLSRPILATRLRELVPILTDNAVLKGVQVPQLPRGRDGWNNNYVNGDSPSLNALSSKFVKRTSRQKFRFPEKELLRFLENEDKKSGLTCTSGPIRRYSHNSKITCTVPLRRKSFIMKRTSLKSSNFAGINLLNPSANIAASKRENASFTLPYAFKLIKQREASRRKSTSTCHSTVSKLTSNRRNMSFSTIRKQIPVTSYSKRNSITLTSKPSSSSLNATSSTSSPIPSSQTQMVLRVRARDGVPQLLIAKKPVRCVVWHWNDRCIRVPFMSAANMMELGPAQHGIMLRQLRYVKSMMHDYPWAKAHLRSLLSKYTAKEVTKEELYPQLNALGQQVQRELSTRAKQHRTLTARKQRLTITLTLATNTINDTIVTKFGRRGRPHASRLLYDPMTPLQLRWRRKHGERSVEFLVVDKIQVIEGHDNSIGNGSTPSFGRGNKKAAAAVAIDPESCLSLVTPTRSLDLQVASSLHREWLANAVRDIISFAHQFKAAKANTVNSGDSSSSCDTVLSSARRSRQAPSS
ncbi:uncharacterized protein PHALS_07038 [Plasmopara halstedii]|uniref:Uncharacterized protein n=1 Tax=Plasmopara halstedii TaxID=4781 RepID=A0A0P1B4L5_PLAHL|nr:uncharacterized protein PHALS_07038 [Plasmopara halstedii]CEG49266.1 hypothetical protein PHALS_07038 [Plasmopara halstedii]|eukprot:XP_024585635.1 hypothetical protein PHALS_07038 [Plasmopara halstedii]